LNHGRNGRKSGLIANPFLGDSYSHGSEGHGVDLETASDGAGSIRLVSSQGPGMGLETASDGGVSPHIASSDGHHLSWTGSSIFSKSNKAQSTKPTTVDVDDNSGRPTTVTLYDYSRLQEKGMNEAADDLESVRSLPSDVLSETGTLPGGTRYQHAAARYIVKVLVEDQDLVAMYEDAIQKTSEAKFVRNHEKLLHSLYFDLKSGKRRMPSEVSAVRFLARKTRRVQISSILYDILVPSDSDLREKLQIQVDKEQHGAFMISRWLADQDNTEPNPEAETQRHDGLDSDSESEDETSEKDVLMKLEATAAYLLVGQPFKTYKGGLHAFLYPDSATPQALNEDTAEAKAHADELPTAQLYHMHTGSNEIGNSPTRSHHPSTQIAVESASEFELNRETL
jgi:hypothetical protein